MLVGQPEFVDNPEPRCPCLLLLDTSGSMIDEPIDQLNRGVRIFREELASDPLASLRVEPAVVTFGGNVDVVQDFDAIENFKPPVFTAGGGTPMGAAIDRGLDLLEARKRVYGENGIQMYRPWVVMITDGAPTDSWNRAAMRVRDGEAARKFSFFAVGVEGADMIALGQIAPPSRPPVLLRELRFQDLFVWLSASLMKISYSSSGEQVPLEPIDGWANVKS